MSMCPYADLNIDVGMLQQQLFEESSTKLHPLGTRLALGGGVVYHYCKITEAVTEGHLVTWKPGIAAIAATKFDADAIGATRLAIDVTVAASLCEDSGWLVIKDGTGARQVRMVESNTVGTAGTTDAVVTLYRGLTTALSATDSVGALYASLFSVQQQNAANPFAECTVGMAPRTFTTGVYYGWVQTWGPAAVTSGVLPITVAATQLQGAEDDDGSIQAPVAIGATTGYEIQPQIIGWSIEAIADTKTGMGYLTCVP